MESPQNRGIRTGRYKLINYLNEEPQEFELYDLANDPGEEMNLHENPNYAAVQQSLWNRMLELEAAIPERSQL